MSTIAGCKFSIKVEKRTVDYVKYAEANYLMIASGSSEQVASGFGFHAHCFFLSLHVVHLNLYSYCFRDTNLLNNLVILL